MSRAGLRCRTRLGDVTELLTGFPFRSSEYATNGHGVRLLRGDNVGQGALRWGDAKRWPPQAAGEYDKYALAEHDLVLAMDRPWIEAGLKFAHVRKADLPCLLVQRVARLRAANGLSQAFLKYVIASRQFTDHVLAVQTGTAVPHISGEQIREYSFDCPPLREQLAIASILGALDDKIDLIRRMNETLEELAATVLLSTEATDQEVLVEELVRANELVVGDGYRAKNSELAADGLPFVRAGNLQTRVDVRTAERLSWDSVRRVGAKRSKPLDTAFTSKGTVGRITLVYEQTPEFVYSPQLCFWRVTASSRLDPHLLHEWMRSPGFSRQVDRVKGQTDMAEYVSLRDQRRMLVPVWPAAHKERLASTLAPLHQRAGANWAEIDVLSALRDSLLPRLISGKLRINDAEKVVGEVT